MHCWLLNLAARVIQTPKLPKCTSGPLRAQRACVATAPFPMGVQRKEGGGSDMWAPYVRSISISSQLDTLAV